MAQMNQMNWMTSKRCGWINNPLQKDASISENIIEK